MQIVKKMTKMKPTSKYRNIKIVVNGIKFDSKKEATRYQELLVLQKAGMITNLKLQDRFEIVPKQPGERKVVYVADFTYFTQSGKLIVEDVKSAITRKNTAYIIKRKLMKLLLKNNFGDNAEFREV